MDAAASGAQAIAGRVVPVSDRAARETNDAGNVFLPKLGRLVPPKPWRRRMRTEKSCGPGCRCCSQASRRLLSAQPGTGGQFNPRGDGDKNEFVAGESSKDTVKTTAQGRPGYRAVPVFPL